MCVFTFFLAWCLYSIPMYSLLGAFFISMLSPSFRLRGRLMVQKPKAIHLAIRNRGRPGGVVWVKQTDSKWLGSGRIQRAGSYIPRLPKAPLENFSVKQIPGSWTGSEGESQIPAVGQTSRDRHIAQASVPLPTSSPFRPRRMLRHIFSIMYRMF